MRMRAQREPRTVSHANRIPCQPYPTPTVSHANRVPRQPCPTHVRPTTHRSTTYQNAVKEANEWVETAKSSDEPTSHDLNPAATLPRLEFVSEARAASDSKQLGVGHAARLASLPQPSFRLARCAKDPRGREPMATGPMAMGRGRGRGLRRRPCVLGNLIAVSLQVRHGRDPHCGRRARVQCLFACCSLASRSEKFCSGPIGLGG